MQMNRKKKSLVYALVVCMLCFLYVRLNGYHFTTEELLYANEIGLRYGPSEEILAEYEDRNGNTVIIGRVGNDLSYVTAERHLFFLWKYADDGLRGCSWDYDKGIWFQSLNEKLIGLSSIEAVTEVYLYYQYGFNDEDGAHQEIYQETVLPVDESGFFMGDWSIQPEHEKYFEEDENVWVYDSYVEGRNADGEVLYQWGYDKDGNTFYPEDYDGGYYGNIDGWVDVGNGFVKWNP